MCNTISRLLFVEYLVDDSDPTGPDAPDPHEACQFDAACGTRVVRQVAECFTDPLRILRRQVTYLTLSSR